MQRSADPVRCLGQLFGPMTLLPAQPHEQSKRCRGNQQSGTGARFTSGDLGRFLHQLHRLDRRRTLSRGRHRHCGHYSTPSRKAYIRPKPMAPNLLPPSFTLYTSTSPGLANRTSQPTRNLWCWILGIFIDSQLKFNAQLDAIMKKVGRSSRIFARIGVSTYGTSLIDNRQSQFNTGARITPPLTKPNTKP
ncbi:hypothetical protein BDZ45DRAFT_92740 [Acephala macrosclerotiorum]|nr:hypothetical protein BDZ45DRAFT_92740 [Acephala macrosclerotiorum]